jgi:hypothetical protein
LSPKTPLAADVDFKILGEKYAVSGGDIKNAVLKAAQIATTEPVPDAEKKITQRHFEQGMDDVVASHKVMEQSIFDGDGSHQSTLGADAVRAMTGMNGAWGDLSKNQESLEEQIDEMARRLAEAERQMFALPSIVERFDDAARTAQNALRGELTERVAKVGSEIEVVHQRSQEIVGRVEEINGYLEAVDARAREEGERLRGHLETTLQSTLGDLRGELGASQTRYDERLEALDGALVSERETLQIALRDEWKTALERRDAQLLETVSGQITRGLEALQSTLMQAQRDMEVTLQKKTTLALSLGGGALAVAIIALIRAFL